MICPYLARTLLPLVVALPRVLEKIETKLTDETMGGAEKRRLRQ